MTVQLLRYELMLVGRRAHPRGAFSFRTERADEGSLDSYLQGVVLVLNTTIFPLTHMECGFFSLHESRDVLWLLMRCSFNVME